MSTKIPRTWWDRNWLWALPGSALLPIILVVGGLALIGYLSACELRSTELYRVTVNLVADDPEVIGVLGENIEPYRMPSGHITAVAGGTGKARLMIPLMGEKGTGLAEMDAIRREGLWMLTKLHIAFEDGRRPIVLIPTSGEMTASR